MRRCLLAAALIPPTGRGGRRDKRKSAAQHVPYSLQSILTSLLRRRPPFLCRFCKPFACSRAHVTDRGSCLCRCRLLRRCSFLRSCPPCPRGSGNACTPCCTDAATTAASFRGRLGGGDWRASSACGRRPGRVQRFKGGYGLIETAAFGAKVGKYLVCVHYFSVHRKLLSAIFSIS
jgi:hypothetical protein